MHGNPTDILYNVTVFERLPYAHGKHGLLMFKIILLALFDRCCRWSAKEGGKWIFPWYYRHGLIAY